MNEWIKTLYEQGLSDGIYYAFHVFGFISCFISAILVGKKLNVPVRKAVGLVLIVLPTLYAWMFFMFWAETGFRVFGGNNIVRVFVFLPLMGLLVAKVLKMHWKDSFHILAVAPLAIHGVAHFGCMFIGCCYGYINDWGLYHPGRQEIRFPIQPIEALAAWAIIAILWLRSKRKNYVSDGLELPIMLMLFGFSRFFFEYLRDNDKYWYGISNLAIHALLMGAVGLIMYAIMRIKMCRQVKNAA